MTLILNGETIETDLPEGATLQQLLTSRSLKADRIAIERNGEIASRQNWQQITLAAGDRLEIVHFVGGGCCPVSW